MNTRYRATSVTEYHPLKQQGNEYIHRIVLFDRIGYGPHRCHWCERHINWHRGLVVDHLDDDGKNNDESNLVPSCNSCNIKRGKPRKLSAEQMTEIVRSTLSQRALATSYGVSQRTINRIIHGKTR